MTKAIMISFKLNTNVVDGIENEIDNLASKE